MSVYHKKAFITWIVQQKACYEYLQNYQSLKYHLVAITYTTR